MTFFHQEKNRKYIRSNLRLPTFEGEESSTSPISQESILTYSELRELQYPRWQTEEDIELFFKSLKRTASVLSRGWKSCGLFSYFLESSGEGIIFELQDNTIRYGGLLHATNNKIYLYNPSEGVVLYNCKSFKQVWTGSYFYASKNKF